MSKQCQPIRIHSMVNVHESVVRRNVNIMMKWSKAPQLLWRLVCAGYHLPYPVTRDQDYHTPPNE